MEDPDPQLVAAARRGDLRAFEALVRRYQGDVWRLSFHLLHDESLADEATQETFVRVFRFLRRFKGDSKFSTWLFSVARNCALDEGRRANRARKLRETVQSHSEPDHPRDEGGGIEVREAVGHLPLELREPIVLIDMFGCSYAEVGRMLRVPVGTIKSRVHRARLLLVESLGPASEEDADEG